MKALTESTTPAVLRALRILVADDHELVRQGLRALLEAQSGWTVCGEATTGSEAVEKAGQLQPDVVVLDVHMPEMDGLEAAREILSANPRPEVLIFTVDESTEIVHSASEVGVHAVVMKSDASRDLVAAISALARHEPFCASKALGIMARTYVHPLGGAPTEPHTPHAGLTRREGEVVVLVAEGRSSKEIATAFNISVKTVESHRANLMHKLGLRSIAELVRYAMRQGLVKP